MTKPAAQSQGTKTWVDGKIRPALDSNLRYSENSDLNSDIVLLGQYNASAASWLARNLQGSVEYLYLWDDNRSLDDSGIARSLHEAPYQFLRTHTKRTYFFPSAGGTPQTLRPISDVSAGSWTPSSGSDLYAMLDETTPSDTDYIQSATFPSNDVCEVKLATGTDPGVNTGHTVSYRIKGTMAAQNLTIQLRQGAGTLIKQWAHTNVPTTETTHEQTLSEGEAGNITDYSDLRLRFIANP
jgi:hypothetical protein